MSRVTITVDGRKHTGTDGEMLLPLLLAAGYDIPHMCYNEAMQPYGACRLCLVEVEQGGRRKVQTSCSYPISDGLVVYTKSEVVTRHRRMVAELLLARCPEVKEIRELADRLGVERRDRFTKKDLGCILCGLCMRACEAVVGVSAISFVGRGPDKEVGTPFLEKSDVCIGCGTCAYICPVGYIQIEEDERERRLPQWKVKFTMVRCKKCGTKIAPKKQIEYFTRKANLPPDWFDYCVDCRPKK